MNGKGYSMREIEYTDEKWALEALQSREKLQKKTGVKFYTIWVVIIMMFICSILFKSGFMNSCEHFYDLEDINANFSKDYIETFEIQLPIIYKNLVAEQTVLTHTFGNSWGVPARVTFTPELAPEEFNRCVLTLQTWVDGIQYDRLAHVFIDDIPVWRTSTAEPGRDLVFSESSKDVSKYLSLFYKDQVDLTFQLDNLLRENLNGAFNTTLSVKYYVEEDTTDHSKLSSYFQVTNKPANRISKLYSSSPKKTPLLYFPSDKLEFTIPIIEANTTNLKLDLYVSGNAAEEFWYSNVLDQNTNKFAHYGHSLLGRGPVRVVNVYLDGVKVSSLAPEPVIFSGGIAPPLWKPIIGVNAFDIKQLEIDLTTFLPILWKSGAKLEIEITNGEEGGKVAQNWITAVDLLHWESSEVESSFGEIEFFDNSTKYKVFTIDTSPENLFQTVLSQHTAEIQSNLTFNFFNGSQVPVKLHTKSEANFTNFQAYSGYGDGQTVTALNINGYVSEIIVGDEAVAKLEKSKVFPVMISLLTDPVVGYDITYDANITHVYAHTISIDGSRVFEVDSLQNGTSTFTLSPKGNHGFGSTDQLFNATLSAPFPELKFNHSAKAINGSLIVEEDYSPLMAAEATTLDLSEVSNFAPASHVVAEIQRLVSDGTLKAELADALIKGLGTQIQSLEARKSDLIEEKTLRDRPALPNIGNRYNLE